MRLFIPSASATNAADAAGFPAASPAAIVALTCARIPAGRPWPGLQPYVLPHLRTIVGYLRRSHGVFAWDQAPPIDRRLPAF